jgi:GLPGLI family protein
MLKNIKIGLIAFICSGSTIATYAQKVIKEGTATYAVEYDLPASQQSMAAMLPKEFKVDFKGDNSKFKMDMGMYATEVIYNSATKESLSLTEVPMQNKKIAVKMTKEQTDKMQEVQTGEKDIEVTATIETKNISGYNCTKYVLKDKISGESADVWATTDIIIPANSLTSSIKNIKGVPVEFSTNARGMKSKMTLKSIATQPVADIKMDIPVGYETMTFEDVMTQMGG